MAQNSKSMCKGPRVEMHIVLLAVRGEKSVGKAREKSGVWYRGL